MILQRLSEHYDRIIAEGRHKISPPGFSSQKVSFCIVLEPDGRLNRFDDMREENGGAPRPCQLILPGQNKPSGQGLNPGFLWDNAEYLLGYTTDPSRQERACLAFEAFRQAHLQFEAQINDPAFSSVCQFLRFWSPDQASGYPELEDITGNFGVFRLAGHTDVISQKFAPPINVAALDAVKPTMCLVSGELTAPARLHEPKIKGVVGAQSAGALLVSFNASAFTSYRKDQSFNAPVGVSTAFKYATALNHLLEHADRRTRLGDTTVVFWADHHTFLEDAFAQLFVGESTDNGIEEDQGRVEQARLLLSQLRDGTQNATLESDGLQTRFFILGLAPNASRLSVRIWVDAEAREMRRRLAEHVSDFSLEGGRNEFPLPFWRIVSATGRAERDPNGRIKFNGESVSPQLAGDLARSVLMGSAYPQSLFAAMIRRIRSDGEVHFARVSAIKACITRNSRIRGVPLELSMNLDPNQSDIAYRCGRLFALLEKAQSDSAGGDLNSTIKDRYFSSASATPALVFPRLFRLNGHHLNKLETGAKIYYERLFGMVMTAPFEFPKQLSLTDQGKFVVGYFQQRQDLYTKKEKKLEENA